MFVRSYTSVSYTLVQAMPSISQIQEAILDFFHSRTIAENLQLDTDLMEAQAIDSLTVMEFVLHTERLFCIRLEGADVSPRNFRTVQTLTSLIAAKGAAG